MKHAVLCLAATLVALVPLAAAESAPPAEKPNFIVINIDDMGYADIGPFGSQLNRTPNLDRMAQEGRKLTAFYAAPVCSPSRASLMTGCYPKRVLPIPHVLFPASAVGLSPAEPTIAELLKKAGYATGCIGKWHLGDQPQFLPPQRGFDYYLGLPYSNDMGPAEDGAKSSLGQPLPKPRPGAEPQMDEMGIRGPAQPPLPLVENDRVIARVKPDEQQGIVERYTAAAVKFIENHRQQPFFLYLPHNAVHFPHYPGKRFAGQSPHGIYSDWVEEVDWSVGQVLDTLRRLKLDSKTLVLFTSDNGGTKSAVNAPLRGFKGSTWEGGMREPTIAWWPGKIPAGTASDAITGMMDVLPTLVNLGGGALPPNRKIDGRDIWPVLAGTAGATGHDVFYYFRGFKLEAVRSGPWKLRLAGAEPAPKAAKAAKGAKTQPPAAADQLYNLDTDIGESQDVAAAHPDVVQRLRKLAAAMDDDLGTKDLGPGVRPLGRVENPQPLLDAQGRVRAGFKDAQRPPPKTSQRRPNVLLLIADDLRPELGCYGATHIQSPHIDALAARGTVFGRAYCQVAVCNASRSSLLAGARPDTTGVLDNQHFLRPQMPDVVTLPQHFKNHGYYAVSLGKIFHHSEREPGDDPQSWSEPAWYHGEPLRHWFTPQANEAIAALKKLPPAQRPKLVRGPPFEAADEPDDSYSDGQIAAQAVATLQRLKAQGQPFFLGVGFHKPHLPFTCPQKYWDLYSAASVRLPENYFPPRNVPAPALHNLYELRTYGGVPAEGPISDELALNLIRGYRACTSFLDAQVGRVLEELDRLGLREETVVVFLGDHGYHLGENGLFTKMTNFECGTHAPLIVSAPGRTAGQHCRALVEFVDVYPTLAELCGLPLPGHLEGASLVPLLDDPRGAGKPAVFSQYLRTGKAKFLGRSVRTDQWRYTEWTDMAQARAGVELYDEVHDPQENDNLAGLPDKAAVVAELAQVLHGGTQPPSPSAKTTAPQSTRPVADAGDDLVLATFEGKNLDGWTPRGEGFHPAPFRSGESGRFTKFEGTGIAWSGRGGAESTGELLSPEFEIQRAYVNFLVWGARDLPGRLGVELLVDGQVVRAASAAEARDPAKAFYWRTWDVRELAGRRARIRVNDRSPLGSIAVDAFTQSNTAQGLPSDAHRLNHESLRPLFHYTAQCGWLNDANGLLYFEGQWHLFHQHRPPDHQGIVWGHAVSRDLLHWQRRPAAIQPPGGDSAASGSGVVDVTNASGLQRGALPPLLLSYTLGPADPQAKMTQCLAYSTDGGQTFEQYAGNPLLRTPDSRDRDPKVFWHAPSRAWIMAVSLSRNNTDREHATYGLFRSADLKSWKLIQELGPGPWYWECPDMYPLPVDGDPTQMKWIFQKGSGDYIIGAFDGHKFTPEVGPIRIHWGGNFYGAQTFNDAPGGRRVHIGWMNSGKEASPNSWPGMPFNQQMSFPREITLRGTSEGPRLFREPIAEIAQLYANVQKVAARPLPPGENPLAGVAGEAVDIEFDLELRAATHLKLDFRGTEVLYDVAAKKLKAFGKALDLAPVAGRLHVRVLIDRTSIELFANHGDVTHAGVFFPSPENRRYVLEVAGGAAQLDRLEIRQLKSIWD